jgi:hypothetical protein
MSLGPVFDAALAAQEVCKRIGLNFCVIGGVALQRWGEPRFTADVDVSVLVEPGEEDAVARGLLAQLESRVESPLEFARMTRVLLLKSTDGIGIDIVLAGLPFEARVIERSSLWTIDENTFLRTCSAEDLLVMKCFAARDKDWADVTSILERLGPLLDLDLVREELQPLVMAKEEPGILEQFELRITRILGSQP